MVRLEKKAGLQLRRFDSKLKLVTRMQATELNGKEGLWDENRVLRSQREFG